MRKKKKSEPVPVATEKHYRVEELATLWGLSSRTIRRTFRDHPGVRVLGSKESTKEKRAYATLLIPQSVAEEVYGKMK